MVHIQTSRIHTWHSPGGLHHNQIDYNLTQKRFAISVNINKTRYFPGADIGMNHDLVMMQFNLGLRSPKKNKFVRLKLNLDQLKIQKVKQILKRKLMAN